MLDAPVKTAERIQKLLALAGSSNEHEAHLALMRAQALIARCAVNENAEGTRKIVELTLDITYSKKRDPWIAEMVDLISAQMRCIGLLLREGRRFSAAVCGFEDDASAAAQSISYAVRFVRKQNRKMEADLLEKGVSRVRIRDKKHAYGAGFVKGLRRAYVKNAELLPALRVPAPVRSYIDMQKLQSTNLEGRENREFGERARGYLDAQSYRPARVPPASVEAGRCD